MNRDDALFAGEPLLDPPFEITAGALRGYYHIPGMSVVREPDEGDHGKPVPRLEFHYAGQTTISDLRRKAGKSWAEYTSGLLDEFIRLDQGSSEEFPDRVLDFAQRFGRLEICTHGVIKTHAPGGCTDAGESYDIPRGASSDWSPPGGWDDPKYDEPPQWEPLDPWLRYVRHLRAILRVAERLQNGALADLEDWQDIEGVAPAALNEAEMVEVLGWPFSDFVEYPGFLGGSPDLLRGRPVPYIIVGDWLQSPDGSPIGSLLRRLPTIDSDWLQSLEAQSHGLSWVMQAWIQLGELVPQFAWNAEESSRPNQYFEQGGLPSVLATKLIAAIMSPKGIYICFNCDMPFMPPLNRGARKPRRGTRPWCPTCGRLAQYKHYNETKRKPRQDGARDP